MISDGLHDLDGQQRGICVIGSGPAGLAVATNLVAKGIQVLLLESGGSRANAKVQALALGNIIDPSRHDDMSIATSRRLGGASNLWGGRSMPYDPVDFVKRDWVGAGWPIEYSELMRWFPAAVQATRGGAAVYDATPLQLFQADSSFDADKIERGVNTQQAQVIHADVISDHPLLDVRTHATVTDIEFAENGRVNGIQIVHSLSGEKVRLQVDTLVVAAGGLETARLLLASRKNAPDRFGGSEGPLGRYYMGHLIGEIADIVFAEERFVDAFDFKVDQHGSYTRRRIMPSLGTQIEHRLLNSCFWPVVPPIADPRHKNAILSSVYLALAFRPLGNLLVAEAIRTRHVPESGSSMLPHVINLITGIPSSLAFIAAFLRRRYGADTRIPGFFVRNKSRRYGWSYHAEQAPNRNSRVWLSSKTDRLGLAQLNIDLRFDKNDAESVVRTHDLLEGWLGRTGLGALEYRMAREDRVDGVLELAAHGTHQIGVARMGTDRHNGVVDANLRTFDSPNLYLASAAVLPTSGQANPTVSTVALSLRLADHLAARSEAHKITQIKLVQRVGLPS
jgi:choline dehydrogenase-like flavoprotein